MRNFLGSRCTFKCIICIKYTKLHIGNAMHVCCNSNLINAIELSMMRSTVPT